MSETDLVTKMIKHLRKNGFWAMKIHGGPMQKAGVPDILAIKNGKAFFFEVKLPGNEATPLQVAVMRDLTEVGALAQVVHSLAELDFWI